MTPHNQKEPADPDGLTGSADILAFSPIGAWTFVLSVRAATEFTGFGSYVRVGSSRCRVAIVKLACAVVIAFFALVVSAQAWSVSGFRARDAGARVKFAVTVCGAKGKHLNFDVDLEPDDGRITYTRRSSGRIPFDCSRMSFSTEDIWAPGVWWARGTVAIGGNVKQTRWKSFYIDD